MERQKTPPLGPKPQAPLCVGVYAYFMRTSAPHRILSLLALMLVVGPAWGAQDLYNCRNEEDVDLRNTVASAKLQVASLIRSIDDRLDKDPRLDIERSPGTFSYRIRLNMAKNFLNCASKKLDSLDYECHEGSRCNRELVDGDRVAWTDLILFARTIHLCESYWHMVQSEKVGALIHEATHACGTNDAAYFTAINPPRNQGIFGWQGIASTYNYWISNGFCIPGMDCDTQNRLGPSW